MSADSIITIGKNATCDLVLNHKSVAGLHAQARLDAGHFLWVRDEDSPRGTFLKRNDGWVRARLITVCAGDLLRFGEMEVTPEQITALFADAAEVRLSPTPKASVLDARTGRYTLNEDDEDSLPSFSAPQRNKETGELVEGEGNTEDLPDFDDGQAQNTDSGPEPGP